MEAYRRGDVDADGDPTVDAVVGGLLRARADIASAETAALLRGIVKGLSGG